MLVSTAGTGERQLFVSYISEVPVWKTTYRLVLGKEAKPLLDLFTLRVGRFLAPILAND